MCGIAGFLDPRRSAGTDEMVATLRAMTDVIVHRGPDGSDTWVDPEVGVGFGHRRLAIVDLSEAGRQPMVSADGRYVITYNGEIYNHEELSKELAADGVRFRGHSDTEVLLEGIVRWGLDATLDRADGMWSFALWDRERRELSLSRDRLGEKPLCYGRLRSGVLVFASTLDAVRRHPDFDAPLDRDALALYFRHKYVPAPWTIHRDVHKVLPGHVVTLRADGTVVDDRAYWSYYDVVAAATDRPFGGSDAEAIDELDRLIRRSVRRRLDADVPVGAFLSGGIDSSTIVGVAQQESSRAVRTFTIGSTDSDYDESSAARDVAEHLGTDHTEQIVTGTDALGVVDLLGTMYDEPFGDSSQIPTYLVSRLARRDVTVSLSGDAGDELFGGYNRYTSVPGLWAGAQRVPAVLRRGAGRVLDGVPPEAWDVMARALPARRRPQQFGLKVTKALSVLTAADPDDAFLRLVTHWPDPERLVPGTTEPPTLHTDRTTYPRTNGIVEHMMAVDGVTYLPDDILVKVDRAAMAISLESRVPLLDRSIVEFAAGLPLSMKIRGGESKWVLRRVLDRYVPTALVDRPKSGFGLPIDSWLRGPLQTWALDLLSTPAVHDHLDRRLVMAAWNAHQSRRRNVAYELWDVLMFAAWAEASGSV